jgi:hypothetical protein
MLYFKLFLRTKGDTMNEQVVVFSPAADAFAVVLAVFVFSAIIIFATRGLWCWYFKINQRIEQNNKIIKALTELAKK